MSNLFTLAINFNEPIHKVCLDSLLKYNPRAKVFSSYEQIKELVNGEEFVDKYKQLSLVHFSDVFRVWYLLNHGGTWIDADCIHLRPFEFPYEINERSVSFIYDDAKQNKINQCLIHSPNPGNEFLLAMLDRQNKLLEDKRPDNLSYLDFGQWSIEHIAANTNIDFMVAPHWEYSYLCWYDKYKFLEHRDWLTFQFDRSFFNPNAYCYHITNAVINFLKFVPREFLLSENYFASFLIRKALDHNWNNHRSCAIIKRLDSSVPNGKYLEVGVYKGETLAIVAQQRHSYTMYAVDPWKNISSQAYKDTNDYIAFQSDDQQQQNYEEFKRRTWFLDSQKRLNLTRESSVVACNKFEDNSFDMVFIDADHSYQGVKQDIELWFNKVKKNGYLGGHDYNLPGYSFGVKQAVDEFVLKHNLKLELDCDYTWFIRK
jgi:hypothetical protein